MSGVFQNIYPHPLTAHSPPPPLVRGRTHSLGGEGVGGSIVRKTPVIGLASYSIIPLRKTLFYPEWNARKRLHYTASQHLPINISSFHTSRENIRIQYTVCIFFCSVLYICKSFVVSCLGDGESSGDLRHQSRIFGGGAWLRRVQRQVQH